MTNQYLILTEGNTSILLRLKVTHTKKVLVINSLTLTGVKGTCRRRFLVQYNFCGGVIFSL